MLLRLLPALALIASPATARQWADAGGWEVGETDTESCYMGSEYKGEGSTLLLVQLTIHGEVFLSASNYLWSAKEKQSYELVYSLDGGEYSGGNAVGIGELGRKGFVTKFGSDFLGDFAKSASLDITAADGTVVDELDLEGSAAGVAQLRRCVAHLKAVAAAKAREKAKLAHIPTDPFAVVEGKPLAPAPVRVVEPAKAKANLQGLISNDDYPAAAIQARQQGTTRVRLSIGVDGRVTGCAVTSSSGSAALDSATCRLLQSRARFTPARDSTGNPQADTYDGAVSWRL